MPGPTVGGGVRTGRWGRTAAPAPTIEAEEAGMGGWGEDV